MARANKTPQWWEEEYGFFGKFYLEGDNSVEGYLQNKKQTLTERTKTEVDGIFTLTKVRPGDAVLDIPCGYGRHSIELAARGCAVTGCDVNSVHLAKAAERAKQQNVLVTFVHENMLNVRYHAMFDAVINMFYSFGFFETDEENNSVLRAFYNALKPGGRFLMHTDVNVPRILNNTYKTHETRQLANGNELRIIDNYNPDTKRIEGAWIIKQPNGNEERKDYSVRVYDKDEFVRLCYEAGFAKVEVYGDWEGGLYSEASEDMMVVATK